MVRGLASRSRSPTKSNRRQWTDDGSWSQTSPSESRPEPRSFPHDVKEACWQKAEVVHGRDPARWRRDSLGNLVFRKLVACQGCLCYNFDHIVPYSQGGKSVLENCQVLQTAANSAKGARTNVSDTELMQKSVYCRLGNRDMDMMELSAYGDIHHENEKGLGGCRIQ
ncbi:hypothetical protein R1flu_012570 [Riccia fluitans]|uniref:HNH domain-containing protein n=1 Tax=Riccia fluitans TaxID=41844 RepID=A0ABD1ZB04_9MARC